MVDRMTVSYQEKPCYDIVFSNDFNSLPSEIGEDKRGRKACIVTDSGAGPLYVPQVKGELEGVF